MRRVVMLLENNPYPQDVRVRGEAEALVGAGHEVTVLAPLGDGQPRREVVRGVHVRRFRLPPDRETVGSLLLEYAVAHVQLIGRAVAALARGADVVHLHNPPDTLFPAGALARLAGRRVVFDSHDLSPELFEEKFGASPLVAFMRLAQRLSFRIANLVIATNESQADVARA
ncbi:MAG: glycosyltransferase, partial [Actinomycetota bacterium]|nr:glycosyltransferase [Actinomycetota bacterium]